MRSRASAHFPQSLANPALHRWTTGGTLGGPILKNKAFFFVGYQHLVRLRPVHRPVTVERAAGLTDDRSAAGLDAAASAWNIGTPFNGTISPIAQTLLQCHSCPMGQFLIPSAQSSQPYQYGVPNVTLLGTSLLTGDQATASVDYNLTKTDQLSVKYYYQNDPVDQALRLSRRPADFPPRRTTARRSRAIDNTISIGSRVNWEQRLGYVAHGVLQPIHPDRSTRRRS